MHVILIGVFTVFRRSGFMQTTAHKLKDELEGLCSSLKPGVRPYTSFDQILELGEEKAAKVLSAISLQRKILEKAMLEEVGCLDKSAFQIALEHLNLRTVDNVEKHFEDGDIIEIYDSNFVQLHHNFVFYYYCSYDVLTLATAPIFDIYSRPKDINEIIFEKTKDLLMNGKSTRPFDIPIHYLKETQLNMPRVFRIQFKVISPLVNELGETVAFVSTNECTPVDFQAV
jgi:hypothetical protein